jgi:hypothetical protein
MESVDSLLHVKVAYILESGDHEAYLAGSAGTGHEPTGDHARDPTVSNGHTEPHGCLLAARP